MSNLEKAQAMVKSLSREEFSLFRDWFAEYAEEVWDKQIEEDSKAGRFDAIIARAKNDIKNGRTMPLDQFLETIK